MGVGGEPLALGGGPGLCLSTCPPPGKEPDLQDLRVPGKEGAAQGQVGRGRRDPPWVGAVPGSSPAHPVTASPAGAFPSSADLLGAHEETSTCWGP